MIKKSINYFLNKLGYKLVKKESNINLHKIRLLSVLGVDSLDSKFLYLKKSIIYLENLKNKKKVDFKIEGRDFVVGIDNLRFYVNTNEEVLILHEVFVDGIYNSIFPNEYAVIDIGMNVGMTSLFFANQSNCKAVFSYEPFDYTYNLGMKNMSLNECSEKIKIYKYGLGYPERNIKVEFSKEFKGSVGINGLAGYINQESDLNEVEISIKDVADNLKTNFNEFEGDFLVKIDCEGAEYEIIERLADYDILHKAKVYIVEWHLKGPNLLKQIFIENEFNVISFNENNEDIGMLYAISQRV